MSKDETCNGWKNWETWNAALWIGNNEGLYHLASISESYQHFTDMLSEIVGPDNDKTPDGVSWNDPKLDINELNEFIQGIRGEE